MKKPIIYLSNKMKTTYDMLLDDCKKLNLSLHIIDNDDEKIKEILNDIRADVDFIELLIKTES